MKSIVTFILLIISTTALTQVYDGAGDTKFQIGTNIQSDGIGIMSTLDYGIGENISFGVKGIYLLDVEDYSEVTNNGINLEEAEFGDRIDLRVRININIGNVINVDENLDVYPGLDLGLNNFGGHLGARYFFTDDFGVFTEFNIPLANYTDDDDFTIAEFPRQQLNNQFNVSVGVSLNL